MNDAKEELDGLRKVAQKIHCPNCSRFLAKILAIPAFVDLRCSRCNEDVVVLITREGEVTTAQKSKTVAP